MTVCKGGDHEGEGGALSQRDHRPVRDGQICHAASENLRLRTAAPQEGVDQAHDRAVIDLKAAPPLVQAAALVRLVELQAALIVDLRNRVRALERAGRRR